MQLSLPGVKYDIRSRLTVPQTLLTKGFCCLPIRTSCVLISALSLITSLIIVSGFLTTFSANNSKGVKEDVDRIVAFLFSAVSLDVISSVLLFFGSLTERKSLLIPYAVLHFVFIALGVVAVGIGGFQTTTTWRDSLISVSVQGMSIYIWAIVVSYYQFMSGTSVLAERLIA